MDGIEQHVDRKPAGFWLSVTDGIWSWKSYVETYFDNRKITLNNRFDFNVDLSNMIVLEDESDVADFTEIYGAVGYQDYTGRDVIYIDWALVAQDCDGVYVPRPTHFTRKFDWLHGWDVESVVTWRSETLKIA